MAHAKLHDKAARAAGHNWGQRHTHTSQRTDTPSQRKQANKACREKQPHNANFIKSPCFAGISIK
jgi:hypothetical protein